MRPQTLPSYLAHHKGSLPGLVAIARGQTPDPIPNSAVKTLSAHGTAACSGGRVGRRQARQAPNSLLPLHPSSRRQPAEARVMGSETFVLAIDQGTTSTRAILFDAAGQPRKRAQIELTQSHPDRKSVV